MNIKSKNGKVIHSQKREHIALCGKRLTIRLFDRMTGLFKAIPNYIETEEEVNCKKCLKLD